MAANSAIRDRATVVYVFQCIYINCRAEKRSRHASNCDALSSPICIYVCKIMYICPSQPETPRLHNSPMFSAGAYNNKKLYLATIGHESAQHSTSSLHAVFRLLLASPIAPATAIHDHACNNHSQRALNSQEEGIYAPLKVLEQIAVLH